MLARRRWVPWIWLLLLALLLSPAGAAQAAVVISSFTAEGANNQVTVRWETASEMDVSGFYIQRSSQVDGTYSRVSSYFVSMGDGVTGYQYQYVDSGLSNGATYYYKLEVLNVNQGANFFGPISVQAGLPTPTPTPTRSLTPTATRTSTPTPAQQATSTRTPTPSPTVINSGQNGYPVDNGTAATSTPNVLQGTSTLSLSGTQVNPQFLTPTPKDLAGARTPDAGNAQGNGQPNAVITPGSVAVGVEGNPLDESAVPNFFDSDILLWVGGVIGALALGVILALVLWSITRRTKAG